VWLQCRCKAICVFFFFFYLWKIALSGPDLVYFLPLTVYGLVPGSAECLCVIWGNGTKEIGILEALAKGDEVWSMNCDMKLILTLYQLLTLLTRL
jgi:hypothetical protein